MCGLHHLRNLQENCTWEGEFRHAIFSLTSTVDPLNEVNLTNPLNANGVPILVVLLIPKRKGDVGKERRGKETSGKKGTKESSQGSRERREKGEEA
jgi:hypothetical protein